MNNPDTICAIATAQGGAIGLIRVSGPDAIAFTDRIFTPVSSSVPLTQRKPYTLTFGHIKNAKGEIIDEVLISVFRAPHSYTGEDSTEISCHGSPYILQQVMQLLISNGCRAAGPGERENGLEPSRSRSRPYRLHLRSHSSPCYESNAGILQPRTFETS